MYTTDTNSWKLAPAYDLTYPLNINLNYRNVSRALSINNKRDRINFEDVMSIAEEFAIKNPKGIIQEVQEVRKSWKPLSKELQIPPKISTAISKEFSTLIQE